MANSTMQTKLLAALVLLGALTLPQAGHAADTPKQGTSSYTTYWVVGSYNPIKLGANGYATSDYSGVVSSDNPMFDHLSAHCLASSLSMAGTDHNSGACVGLAPDGSQLFLTYEITADAQGRNGANHFIGGTGKFEGISGGGSIAVEFIKGPDGKVMFVSHHNVEWKLP